MDRMLLAFDLNYEDITYIKYFDPLITPFNSTRKYDLKYRILKGLEIISEAYNRGLIGIFNPLSIKIMINTIFILSIILPNICEKYANR